MNARKHTFGKEIMEPMSAIMFFNCCQRACETCTSKATPRMIRCKHVASTGSSGCPKRDGAVLTICNGTPKSCKGSCGRTTPRPQLATQSWWRPHAAPGETGCFFPPARCGSGDCLADAPFPILNPPGQAPGPFILGRLDI